MLPSTDERRDSVSSNGSWIRRLSIRPLSHHENERTSISAEPAHIVMPNTHDSIPQLLSSVNSPVTPHAHRRNRLVKRQQREIDEAGRQGARSFRRPATSHQRTGAQKSFPSRLESPALNVNFSFEYSKYELQQSDKSCIESGWKSFFHDKVVRVISKGFSPRQTPYSEQSSSKSTTITGLKKILLKDGHQGRVYLVKPRMAKPSSSLPIPARELENTLQSMPKEEDVPAERHSIDGTPSKSLRNSSSTSFVSPTNWISQTGSLKRVRRGNPSQEGGKRYVSAPATSTQELYRGEKREIGATSAGMETYSIKTKVSELEVLSTNEPVLFSNRHYRRNSSSPLPPITRLSSLHLDLSCVGLGSSNRQRTPSSLTSSPYHFLSDALHSTTLSREHGMISPDTDPRECFSTDEDTDFKSETVYDSIRTAESIRRRNLDTPLDSIFDDTPPSTASIHKPRLLSVQDMLDRSFEDEDDKITEEEDSIPTPVRTARSSTQRLALITGAKLNGHTYPVNIASPSLPFESTRPSFDDDEWARDCEDAGFANHLSPPSSLCVTRHVNPMLRAALGSISGNGNVDAYSDAGTERPRSIFDWTESSVYNKIDSEGNSFRPRTVHGKQEVDLRGGRASSRRPIALHVRSQSVPIVPEQPDNTKSTPKFGTWATGKNVSEDWDEDFDFGEPEQEHVGETRTDSSFGMIIPTSIQASQPTIKAHTGQIREFSLLVNELKRLCREMRNLRLINNHTMLWKEAQGIIALASPDDDSSDDSSTDSSLNEFDGSADESTDDDGTMAGYYSHKLTPTQKEKPTPEQPTFVSSPRRRSVFSPEDDIFGSCSAAEDIKLGPPQTPVRPTYAQANSTRSQDVVARTVMEAVHQQQVRSASDPTPNSGSKAHAAGKLNFDTNSLRELVKRARELQICMSDILRRDEGFTNSPVGTPRHQRGESPAFTQVFDGPHVNNTPNRRILNSHGNNSSVLSRRSLDTSPPAGVSQRIQVMTVN